MAADLPAYVYVEAYKALYVPEEFRADFDIFVAESVDAVTEMATVAACNEALRLALGPARERPVNSTDELAQELGLELPREDVADAVGTAAAVPTFVEGRGWDRLPAVVRSHLWHYSVEELDSMASTIRSGGKPVVPYAPRQQPRGQFQPVTRDFDGNWRDAHSRTQADWEARRGPSKVRNWKVGYENMYGPGCMDHLCGSDGQIDFNRTNDHFRPNQGVERMESTYRRHAQKDIYSDVNTLTYLDGGEKIVYRMDK